MDAKILFGLITRHALTALGGVLVSRGLIESTDIEGLTGAVLLIAGVIWSVLQKNRSAKS